MQQSKEKPDKRKKSKERRSERTPRGPVPAVEETAAEQDPVQPAVVDESSLAVPGGSGGATGSVSPTKSPKTGRFKGVVSKTAGFFHKTGSETEKEEKIKGQPGYQHLETAAQKGEKTAAQRGDKAKLQAGYRKLLSPTESDDGDVWDPRISAEKLSTRQTRSEAKKLESKRESKSLTRLLHKSKSPDTKEEKRHLLGSKDDKSEETDDPEIKSPKTKGKRKAEVPKEKQSEKDYHIFNKDEESENSFSSIATSLSDSTGVAGGVSNIAMSGSKESKDGTKKDTAKKGKTAVTSSRKPPEEKDSDDSDSPKTQRKQKTKKNKKRK